jgi:hypothetical protein
MGFIIFCFGGSSLPLPLIVAGASMLGALALRDALTYKAARSQAQYYLDSAGDAAVAGVFLLAAEAMTLNVAPSATLPTPALYRGALVCLPMIPILRMVLRPRPDPESPGEETGLPAETLYRRTWRMNTLWAGTVNGIVFMTVSDRPNSISDSLGTGGTLLLMGLLIALQRNALQRRSKIATLFTNVVKQKKVRLKETLAQGIEKHEPLYKWYVAIGWALYFNIARAMAVILWPWLSGDPGATLFRPAAAIVGFAVVVLTWPYVKASNLAAARALQAEIDGASTQTGRPSVWSELIRHSVPSGSAAPK